jgi:hypothetical protein
LQIMADDVGVRVDPEPVRADAARGAPCGDAGQAVAVSPASVGGAPSGPAAAGRPSRRTISAAKAT